MRRRRPPLSPIGFGIVGLLLLAVACLRADDEMAEPKQRVGEKFGTRNGGWQLSDEQPIPDNGRCNIERRDARQLSQEEFFMEYAHTKPVIIENVDNTEFQRLTERAQMVADWRDTAVVLNSANTFSYARVPSNFEEYVNIHLKPQSLETLGNETLYLFGDISPEIWSPLLKEYRKPLWTVPDFEPALSFGIAGAGTGVPFHFHGPGFAEVIHGSKRWFLTPYERQPKFNPDKSTLDWYLNDYPKLKANELPDECLMRPGELIFFPHQWWHATLNMETSVFISTFLSPSPSKSTKKSKRNEL